MGTAKGGAPEISTMMFEQSSSSVSNQLTPFKQMSEPNANFAAQIQKYQFNNPAGAPAVVGGAGGGPSPIYTERSSLFS